MAIDEDIFQKLLVVFHEELVENHEQLTNGLLAIGKVSDDDLSSQLSTLFRASHNIKGAAKSVSLDKIASTAHQLEDKFSEWRTDNYRPTTEEINHCLNLVDTLLSEYDNKSGNQQQASEIIKIPLARIEKANVKVDDFITYQLRFNNWLARLKNQLSINSNSQKDMQILLEESSAITNDFSRALASLQAYMRDMRLLPLNSILSPLERSAHDLAESMNKKISFEVKGADTEIDKAILDLLKDPLQHLLRNAIDHGIESPDQRELNKKNPAATILIEAIQEEGKIKILFKDDGCGIDLNTVKEKAINKKFVTEEKLAKMSNTQILNFITYPGFSTRDEVSEISGRGVGLDVVTDNLKQSKGKLKIDSEVGVGTTFTMILPLTLATTRGIFINVNNRDFMIPSLAVNSIHEIHSDDIKLVASERVVIIDDNTIPIRFLSSLLSAKSDFPTLDCYHGIIIGDLNHQIVILVDSVEDEYDCVIKPMVKPFDSIALYMGLTLIGSGDLVPILDSKELLKLSYSFDSSLLEQKYTANKTKKINKILVVDDSITTRSLSANALTAVGFEVDTAINGEIAWVMLQKDNYDCVITDIEMPILDGFSLTKRIKLADDYKSIPVIIVSSCESDDDKAKGIECGADAYLVKSQFSTRSLIEAIEDLL